MTINRYVYPYEILFRLMQSGEVQGCHRRDIEIVKDDDTGEIYSTRETDPVSISGADMEAVLGTVNTALVASLAAAQSQAVDFESQFNNCQADVQQIAQERADIAAQLAQANETIAQLNAQLQALYDAQASELSVQNVVNEQGAPGDE
ncbi:MAG TPA: hypothetical protein VL987_12000 [Cellvibrio sp.]|nr:hypothetical protein [Cellvibrio sp.]